VIAWLVIAGGRTAMDSLESIRSLVLITAAMIGLEIVAGILLLLVIRRFEGFARGWERGSLVPEDAAPAWPQPGAPAYAAGPLNPGAPAAWPDAATAPDAPFDDPRTIESIVVSADGPPAPPPPASGPAASGPSALPPPPASA